MAKKPIETKKLPVRNSANVRSDSEKLLRALIVLFILMSVTTALLFGLVALRRVMFSANPRFQLREIVVLSEGYWQDRSTQLAARLGVHPGENLFAVDPGVLRRQLAAIPNVEHCEVTRVLPDTLRLRVVERIPRAVLTSPQGRWVVDEEGIVFPRAESMLADRRLPVILGFSDQNLEGGVKVDKLRPALEVIMQVARNFRDIEIQALYMQEPDKINMVMRFRGQKNCQALLPVGHRSNIGFLLTALQSAILQAERRGDQASIFNLSFDGNVILR